MLSSLNADLHSHSTRSDGVLTPSALAERAKRNGVELWALTDHDEVSGIAEARAAAADLKMPFIAGVEVSVTWAGKTVHIVGLGIDENNADLKEGLRQTRSGRERRAHDIAAELEKAAGIRGAGHKRQREAEMAISVRVAILAREIAKVGDWHSVAVYSPSTNECTSD